MATTKITDLTAYTDPVSTDVLPIVDVTSDVTKKVSIANVMKNASLGTAALPGIAFDGDPNTGIYSPGADQVAISTNGTERMRLDSSGRLSLGTTSAAARLHVSQGADSSIIQYIQGSSAGIRFGTSVSGALIEGVDATNGATSYQTLVAGGSVVRFDISGGERARIDSSGRLLVGTSSALDTETIVPRIQSADAGNGAGFGAFRYSANAPGPLLHFFKSRGTTVGTNTIVAADDVLGQIRFTGADGTNEILGATIEALVDGTPGTNDMPGRLVFNTTADGASSPTERMRITSAGRVGIGTASPALSLDVNGGQIRAQISSVDLRLNPTDAGLVGTYSNHPVVFVANSTERARIDSSGRLLVGTSSAVTTLGSLTAKLEVFGDSVFDTGISTALFSADTNPSQIQLLKSRNATTGSQTVVQNGDSFGRISFGGSDGTAFQTGAWIQAQVDGTPGANDMPGRLMFSTTADGASIPTERMRIASTGGTNSFVGASNFNVRTSSTSASDGTFIVWNGAVGVGDGTPRFVIRADGDCENTNNSYGALSDRKLKENIVDANSQWVDLKALQVRNYNFKEGQTHKQIGLIAQEVELVSPGLVSESPDRDEEGNDLGTTTKSVNYSVLYMKAVKALQEAMERIETLEAKVAALEAK